MVTSESAWADVALFLRAQRKLAQLSLRHLARLTNVSDSYLSQVERGLYQPSPDVLKSIAGALKLPVAQLYERLGWLDPREDGPTPSRPRTAAGPSVEQAIEADPRLSARQKSALREMYRTLVASAPAPSA